MKRRPTITSRDVPGRKHDTYDLIMRADSRPVPLTFALKLWLMSLAGLTRGFTVRMPDCVIKGYTDDTRAYTTSFTPRWKYYRQRALLIALVGILLIQLTLTLP